MLALGSFLNYTFDSGQILGARPLIISRCNCGNISADLSLCYQVSGSQTVQVVEINILQDTTRPSPLLTAQATIENYNSEYSVLLILGLHTNILVLIDKTINQISSQKKKMFCILFDSFIKQISQHSSFLGRALFLKCSSSQERSFPFGYIVGLDEYQFQSSFMPDEKIESLYTSQSSSKTTD